MKKSPKTSLFLRSLLLCAAVWCAGALARSEPMLPNPTPFANPGNLGTGSIPPVPDPGGGPQPPQDDMPPLDVEFDEETGYVTVSWGFQEQPGANTYRLEYIDSDYHAPDLSWNELTTFPEGSEGQGEFVDETYGVNARRYYRIIALNTDGERIPGWRIDASVYEKQRYSYDWERKSDLYAYDLDEDDATGYGPGGIPHLSYPTSVTNKVDRLNCFGENGEHYEMGFSVGFLTTNRVTNISPVYALVNILDDVVVMDQRSSSSDERYGDHDYLGDNAYIHSYKSSLSYNSKMTAESGTTGVNFSFSEIEALLDPLSYDSSKIFPEGLDAEATDQYWLQLYSYGSYHSVVRLGYSFSFDRGSCDFLLDSQEKGRVFYELDGESTLSYMDLRFKVPHLEEYQGTGTHSDLTGEEIDNETHTYEEGKLEVSWDMGNLEVEVYNEEEERYEQVSSPYVFGDRSWELGVDEGEEPPTNVFNEKLRLTRNASAFDDESDLTFKMYEKDETAPFLEEVRTVVFQPVPELPDPDSYQIPVSDATGPRYRKIGLDGRPLRDEKPQAEGESDGEAEETYVDAFNLNLVHSVTDVYVPVEGSDLALEVRRNLKSAVWTEVSGLRPGEDPAAPFGGVWTSNLGAHVRVTTPLGPDVDQFEEPVEATVTDHTGGTHRFVRYGDAWFPLPSAVHETRAYTTELTEGETTFTFTGKHGTTLTFEKLEDEQAVPRDRINGSENYQILSYARLVRTEDRLGHALAYEFGEGAGLIPQTIRALSPGDVPIPGKQIYIRQSGNRVVTVWDPAGNATEYQMGVASDCPVLTRVIRADGSEVVYGYHSTTEEDSIPRPSGAPEVDYTHVSLNSVTDANGNTHTFAYQFDHSREIYVSNSEAEGYYVQNGLPRFVQGVDLPGEASVSFTHGNLNPGSRLRLTTSGPDYQDVAVNGIRTNTVVDAEGHARTYTFDGVDIRILHGFRDLAEEDGLPEDAPYRDPRLLYYTRMTINHGSAYGTEVFEFLPEAGLALERVTDLSGNVTTYQYEDAHAVPAALSAVWPNTVYGYYDDPTREMRAAPDGGTLTRTYEYDTTFRKMKTAVDPLGRRTETEIDDKGRRTSAVVKNAGGQVVKETTFTYGSASWPGLATEIRVHTASDDPAWAEDLVTTHNLQAHATGGVERTDTVFPVQDADGAAVPPSITQSLFDYAGNRVAVTDPRNHVTVTDYDDRNRPVKVTHPDDSFRTFTYDLRGNRVMTTDEEGHRTGVFYDIRNRPVRTVVDLNGNLDYDEDDGELEGVDLDLDMVTDTGYNHVGSPLVKTVHNGALDRVTRYEYDALQRPRFERQLATENQGLTGDIVTEFAYDGPNAGGTAFDVSGFQPTRTVDPRGYVTEVDYDVLYRPVETRTEYKSGSFVVTEMRYDDVGNPVEVEDHKGRITHTVYDALDRPLTVTRAYGTADAVDEHTEYTGTGLAWKHTDALDRVTVTRYDGAGRRVRVITPSVPVYGETESASPVTRTYYDAAGNAVRTINPLGEIWETTYDNRNRPTLEEGPEVFDADTGGTLRPITLTFYDDLGNVTSVTDPRNHTTFTEYDAAGRSTYTFTAAAPYWDPDTSSDIVDRHTVTRTLYDAAGNVEETWAGYATAPTSQQAVLTRQTALNTYDALGRLLSATDAAGITVSNAYDPVGNRIQVIDGEQNISTFAYDGLGRNTATTYVDDTTTTTYDALHRTHRTDPNGEVTQYDYDVFDRLITVEYIGAPEENRSYAYDDVGNLLSVTHPNGDGLADVATTYDALNRVETETSAGETHRYRYDLAGNTRETVYGEGGVHERSLVTTYDALNRAQTFTEDGRTTIYAYDLAGNLRLTTQPTGDEVRTLYDARGRRREIVGPGAAGAELYRSLMRYDLYGNLARLEETYPGGQLHARVVENTYDLANRLAAETIRTHDGPGLGAPLASTVTTTYGYDDAHNRVSKTVVLDEAGQAANTLEDAVYTVNGKNQLTGFTDSAANRAVTYAYDDNGNRISRTEDGKLTTYAYDRENRLTEVVVPPGVETRTLRATPGTAEHRHPEAALDIDFQVQHPAKTYRYAYDHRTRRVLRDESAAGGEKTFLVFSGGTSAREWEGSGATLDPTTATLRAEHIRGSDWGGGVGGILYTLRAGAPSYAHYNSRGDVVARTGADGSLTYQAAYEAYGKHGEAPGSQEWGTSPERHRANTKPEDPTGLLNEGFRYRDLETGTFITRDPLGFVDGPNVYTYVVQNPWTMFDPHGLSWLSWAFGKGYSGPEAKAFDRGFVEGVKKSKVAKWAYTGNANASSESMNVAVDSVGKEFSGDVNNTFSVGSGESGSPSATANASLTIWNLETSKLDLKLEFSAEANVIGFKEGNTKGGLLGGSIAVGGRLSPSNSDYGLNIGGEVHGFTAEATSPVISIPGTNAGGVFGGGFSFLSAGFEGGANFLNSEGRYNGIVGLGVELFNLSGLVHYNPSSEPGAVAGSAELAFGTSAAFGGGVNLNKYPMVERASGKVVTGVGGGFSYEIIDDEKVGEN